MEIFPIAQNKLQYEDENAKYSDSIKTMTSTLVKMKTKNNKEGPENKIEAENNVVKKKSRAPVDSTQNSAWGKLFSFGAKDNL